MSAGTDMQWKNGEPDLALGRKLAIASWVVTALVYLLTGIMHRPEFHITLPAGWSTGGLPAFHAILNSLTAITLVAALVLVKRGRADWHRRAMFLALGLSGVFLLSYVAYHFTTAEVRFGDLNHDGLVSDAERAAAGWRRPVYLVLLICHISAAALSLPFILLAFSAALSRQFDRHRRLARRVFPVWLFVAVSGPVCYWMLRPYAG